MQLLSSNVANLATLEGGSCTVPEAVVTAFCTRDDGCGCLATLEGGSCTVPEAVVTVLCTHDEGRG